LGNCKSYQTHTQQPEHPGTTKVMIFAKQTIQWIVELIQVISTDGPSCTQMVVLAVLIYKSHKNSASPELGANLVGDLQFPQL